MHPASMTAAAHDAISCRCKDKKLLRGFLLLHQVVYHSASRHDLEPDPPLELLQLRPLERVMEVGHHQELETKIL